MTGSGPSVEIWVTVVLAAAGAALLLPVRWAALPSPPPGATAPRTWVRPPAPALALTALLVVGLLAATLVPGLRESSGDSAATGARALLHGAIATALGCAGVLLWRRGRQRRAAAQLAEQVLEACLVLADELRAGRSAERALELAAQGCSALDPAVRAARLGADVPGALRRGGHRDLRLVAGAWQVAHRSGDGLADALARVGEGLRAARATRRVVGSELASARSTARLLVALPVLALVAAQGTGGGSWQFLLTTTAGTLCLAAGLVLEVAGLWWIESIAGSVEREL